MTRLPLAIAVACLAASGCSRDRGESAASAPPKAVGPGAGVVSASELGPRQARVIPVSSKSQEAMRRFSKGRELQENVRMAEAAEEFRGAIEADPDFALAYAYLASVTGGDDGARAAKKAVELSGELPEAERALVRALVAARTGRRDEAEKLYREVAALNPRDWRAHKLVGDAAMRVGRSDEAIEAYRRATELNPRAAEPHNNLAYLHVEQGRHADALTAARRYVELRPSQPNPLDSLGEIYLRAGRLDDAERAFERALELSPSWAVSHSGVGVVRAYRGDWPGAVEAFTAYAKGVGADLDDDCCSPGGGEKNDGLTYLMWAHLGAGNDAEASALARRIGAATGRDFYPELLELELALLEGHAPKVLKKARRLTRAARGSKQEQRVTSQALAARAFAEVQLGRVDRAERTVERLAKLRPADKPTYGAHDFAVGVVALAGGDPERALERLAKLDAGPVMRLLAERAHVRALRALGRDARADELGAVIEGRRLRDPAHAYALQRLARDRADTSL